MYCHEDPSDIQVPLTKGAIFLVPSINEQQVLWFTSLNPEKKITRRSWDTIPMPDIVIACVNKLACNEPDQYFFTDRRGYTIVDINITGLNRDAADKN